MFDCYNTKILLCLIGANILANVGAAGNYAIFITFGLVVSIPVSAGTVV